MADTKHEPAPSVDDERLDKIDRYNRVVERAQLNHVRVLNVEFDVKPAFFATEGVKLSYDVREAQSLYIAEESRAFAVINMVVEGRKGRSRLLNCHAKYVVGYDGIDDCDNEAVGVFLSRVAPFACYPYFRSLFATLDWSASTGLPPLPIHKEPPRSQEQSSASELSASSAPKKRKRKAAVRA